MTTPFVTQLRSRPSTIRLARGRRRHDHDSCRDAGGLGRRRDRRRRADESVVNVKMRALEALFPDAQLHEDFVIKLRGWEILDENASLADAGVDRRFDPVADVPPAARRSLSRSRLANSASS